MLSRFMRWAPPLLVAVAAALTVIPIWVEFEGGWGSCGSIVFRSTVESRAGTRADLCEQIGAYRDRGTLALVLLGLGLTSAAARVMRRRLVGSPGADRAPSRRRGTANVTRCRSNDPEDHGAREGS